MLEWKPNENTRIFYHAGHELKQGQTYTPYEQGGHYSVVLVVGESRAVINPNNPNSFGKYNFIPGETID